MKLLGIFSTVKDFLTSPLRLGAIEISPTSLKYLLIRGNTIVQASLRLPPGVLERGVIKNRPVFVAALKNLHAQITQKQSTINVILAIPSSLVFAQMFTVPIVAKENLDESIKLNLQMTSPNKIEESYYDYQEIKINKDLGHLDLLGAFTATEPINEYQKALEEANFVPVAVEFPGMSLARLIRQRWGGIDLDQRYLLLYLSAEGVLLGIIKNGNLAFNHYTPWQDSTAANPAAALDFTEAKDVIKREIQRVLNFYLSRTGKSIEEIILVSPVFNYEIVKMATEDLKLKIRNLSIAELPKLQPSWFPALGAALRGLTSRGKDVDISLAAASSQTEFYQERALNFVALWRNILISTFVIIIGAFVTVDSIFVQQQKQAEDLIANSRDLSINNEEKDVQKKIADFNAQLEKVSLAAANESTWSPTLILLNKLAGPEFTINSLQIASKSKLEATMAGQAISSASAFALEARMNANSYIGTVDGKPGVYLSAYDLVEKVPGAPVTIPTFPILFKSWPK